MENKDEIMSVTKSWLQEIAEEQFDTKLTEEQLEAVELAIIEGGISDFLYDQVSKVLYEQNLK